MSQDLSASVERIYYSENLDKMRRGYDKWASRYDEESAAIGYRLPALASAYVTRYVPKGAGPILDAGCGTGLVGENLFQLGYRRLVAVDLSTEMLEVAATRRIYSRLVHVTLDNPLPFDDDCFDAFVATAVATHGHVPPVALRGLLRVVKPGGFAIFNVRDDAWETLGHREKIERLVEEGVWRLREESDWCRPFAVENDCFRAKFFVFEKL